MDIVNQAIGKEGHGEGHPLTPLSFTPSSSSKLNLGINIKSIKGPFNENSTSPVNEYFQTSCLHLSCVWRRGLG